MVIFFTVFMKIKWWLPYSKEMRVKCVLKLHTRYVNIIDYVICLYLDMTLPALLKGPFHVRE